VVQPKHLLGMKGAKIREQEQVDQTDLIRRKRVNNGSGQNRRGGKEKRGPGKAVARRNEVRDVITPGKDREDWKKTTGLPLREVKEMTPRRPGGKEGRNQVDNPFTLPAATNFVGKAQPFLSGENQ